MTAKLVLLGLLLLGAKGASASLNVGQAQPRDEVIEHASEHGRASPDHSLSFTKTYAGDNYQVITRVSVGDAIGNGGAYAAIVAGGPGHTFVTMTYTVLRRAEFHFELKVFGRPPAFSKIP